MFFSLIGEPTPTFPNQPRKTKTEYQRRILLASFQSNPFLDSSEKSRLANLLNISERHVRNWFAHTRVKAGKLRKVKKMKKHQKQRLMEAFQNNPNLDFIRGTQLAILTNTSQSKVNNWFTKCRIKKRRKSFLESMTQGEHKVLGDSFKANRLVSSAEKCRLAKLLKTSKGVIQYWFTETRKEETKKAMLMKCKSVKFL